MLFLSFLERILGDVTWRLYAAEGYLKGKKFPAAQPTWNTFDFIGWDASLSIVPGAQWIAANISDDRIVFRGNSFLSVLQATVSGMGVAALPTFMGAGELTLRGLGDQIIGERTAWMFGHPDVMRTARVRAVADFLVELFAGLEKPE